MTSLYSADGELAGDPLVAIPRMSEMNTGYQAYRNRQQKRLMITWLGGTQCQTNFVEYTVYTYIYTYKHPGSICFWEKIIATVVTDLQQHKPRCDGGHMPEHTMLLAWSVHLCIYCFVYLMNCPWC